MSEKQYPPLAWHRLTQARFMPHPRAVLWRAMRSTGKQGAQEPLFNAAGMPLHLALEATIDDLRRELAPEGGRIILIQVDEACEPIYAAEGEPAIAQAQVEIRVAPPVEKGEIDRLLVDELRAARDERAAMARALLDANKDLTGRLKEFNVAPLEAFKAGMKFATEQVKATGGDQVKIVEVPSDEVTELPAWVGVVLEQAKPFIDQLAPFAAKKALKWLTDEAGAAVPAATSPANGAAS